MTADTIDLAATVNGIDILIGAAAVTVGYWLGRFVQWQRTVETERETARLRHPSSPPSVRRPDHQEDRHAGRW